MLTGVKAAKELMRKSAAEIDVARPRMGGVTLLELLVVITILGILATVSFSQLRVDQSALALENEAERFAARIALARDEAMIVGQPLAVIIETQRYGFARLMQTQADGLEWLPVERPRALSLYGLPDERIKLVLWIGGERQSLIDADGLSGELNVVDSPRVRITPVGDLTPFKLGFRRPEATGVERWVSVSQRGDIDVTGGQ